MELQARQEEFKTRGAALIVLGSLPEPLDVAREKAKGHGITYPILYDAETSVTRKLGLWSDRMRMPFMGYVIVDESGRIAYGEQVLSEATGAASGSIDQILAALQGARGGVDSGGNQPGR